MTGAGNVLKFPGDFKMEPGPPTPADGDGEDLELRLVCLACGSRHFFVGFGFDVDNSVITTVDYVCTNCLSPTTLPSDEWISGHLGDDGTVQ